jgi:uncharacterized membrane protein (UPF0127 family)
VPPSLSDFPTAAVGVGDESWTVAVADTAVLRVQGLRGVADLGGLDGMLFSFPEDSAATFTMRGTLIPLDIAFFTADGTLVDRLEMVPCSADPCPSYRAAGPYRYALETPAGGFDAIAVLRLDPPGG